MAPARAAPAVPVETAVAAALGLLVAILVLVPLVAVALGAASEAGGFSLRPLLTVLGSTRIIANTLVVGIGATLLAVTAGAALALMLARIRTPGRALLSRLVTLPLYITPLLTAIAWSWLGSPRGGLINLFARQMLGIDSLVNLHTPGGVIFVSALSYVPLPFLLIGAALRGMDPSLEESARVHGAATLRFAPTGDTAAGAARDTWQRTAGVRSGGRTVQRAGGAGHAQWIPGRRHRDLPAAQQLSAAGQPGGRLGTAVAGRDRGSGLACRRDCCAAAPT